MHYHDSMYSLTNNFLHKPRNVLSVNVSYIYTSKIKIINPLNTELNPICQ